MDLGPLTAVALGVCNASQLKTLDVEIQVVWASQLEVDLVTQALSSIRTNARVECSMEYDSRGPEFSHDRASFNRMVAAVGG